MRLICVLFLLTSLSFSAPKKEKEAPRVETYVDDFGSAGNLILQYSMTSSIGSSYTMRGNAVNNTQFPLFCVVNGTSYQTSVLNARFNIPPGNSVQEVNASVITLAGGGLPAIKTDCAVPIQFNFTNQTVSKKFDGGEVLGAIGLQQIALKVTNDSELPIEIVWDESSYIDTSRTAKRVLHSGVKYIDKEKPLPNTVIPPLAKIEDVLMPTSNVNFAEGKYGGWRTSPLFPEQVKVTEAADVMKGAVGQKSAVFLQLIVGGKKVPVTLTFEISGVTPRNLQN